MRQAPRSRVRGERVRQSRAETRGRHGEQLLDRSRSRDLAAVDEGLVIALDLVEIVEVIAHDPEGLREPLRRQVPLPVDALKPGAVAEMKAGDLVGNPAVGPAR